MVHHRCAIGVGSVLAGFALRLDSRDLDLDPDRAALELVDHWPNVKAANDEPYTIDPTAVAAARERLAQAIVTMQAAR